VALAASGAQRGDPLALGADAGSALVGADEAWRGRRRSRAISFTNIWA
jgi:hypothetical protein